MTQYRVSCTEHTSDQVDSKAAAWQQMFNFNKVCTNLHMIYVEQENGEWMPLRQHEAHQILTAKLGSTFDGLVLCRAGWSFETAERAGAVAESGTPEWYAALGPHEHATLTADGQGVETSRWCGHDVPADAWVRYEHWSTQGMEAHGYACPNCRHLVQSG